MDYSKIPSPAFVLDEKLLRQNLELINVVQQEADIEIILAFKGFAMWSAFPLVREYFKWSYSKFFIRSATLFRRDENPRSRLFSGLF
jgi:carboxynorspermidine decarboxylase